MRMQEEILPSGSGGEATDGEIERHTCGQFWMQIHALQQEVVSPTA